MSVMPMLSGLRPDAGAPFPSATPFFLWDAETAQPPPSIATFTRASEAQVLTTTDGTTFWYQEAKIDELRLDGLRREENALQDVASYDDFGSNWFFIGTASDGGGGVLNLPAANDRSRTFATSVIDPTKGDYAWGLVELSGSGTVSISLSDAVEFGAVTIVVTLSATPTIFVVVNPGFSGATSATAQLVVGRLSGATATSVTMTGCAIVRGQVGNTANPPNLFDPSLTFNANVPGVKLFNTENGNTIGPGDVFVGGVGAAITGGGYLPEPAATNLVTESSDSAGYSTGSTTLGAQQVRSSGLNSYNVNANTASSTPFWFPTATMSFVSGTLYTCTLVIEDVDAARVLVRVPLNTSGSTRGWVNFDLVGNTVNSQSASIVNARIKADAGGTSRCEVTWTPAANVSGQPLYQFTDLTTVPAETSNLAPAYSPSNENLIHHHTQVDASAFGTSLIVTFGSPVTRVADSLTDAAWPAEASAVVDTTVAAVIPGGDDANRQNMLGFGAGANRNFQLFASNQAAIINGGISSTITASSSYEGERHSFGMSLTINEGIVADDEDNDNTDVTGTPGQGTIYIGSNSLLQTVPAIYHQIKIFAQVQTVDQLKGQLP